MIEQDSGSGVLDVPGRGDQDHGAGLSEVFEVMDRLERRWPSQFGAVAARELLEAIDIVLIPTPELGAGGHILEPFVQFRRGSLHPSGPQTVNQDPVAGRAGTFVDAMDLERDRPRVRPRPNHGLGSGNPMTRTTRP